MWAFLRRALEDYEVHLGTFIDDPSDYQHVPYLDDRCASTRIVRLRPRLDKLKSLPALLTGQALTERYFYSARLARWAGEVRDRYQVERVWALCSSIASHVMGPGWDGLRRVIDFMDIDSDKWKQYAQRLSGLRRWIHLREARRLLEFERRVAGAFDATLFVSDNEANLFAKLAPEVADRVHGIKQGVEHAYFDPTGDHADPYAAGTAPIVFTGTMDYWPNADAVTWFVNEVFPAVRADHPDAQFAIVGSRPTPAVKKLGDEEGVLVTGRVQDIRPWMAHARLMVAPLRIARGVQSKVLEGMAMGLPTVVSPLAMEGLDVRAGEHVLVADTPGAFAEAVGRVLGGEAPELGESGRARVVERHDWDAAYRRVVSLLEG